MFLATDSSRAAPIVSAHCCDTCSEKDFGLGCCCFIGIAKLFGVFLRTAQQEQAEDLDSRDGCLKRLNETVE